MTISGRRYPDGGDSVQLLFDEQQRAVAVGHAVCIVHRGRRQDSAHTGAYEILDRCYYEHVR